ncbi:MAG: bis(5'-nucleosyl)-tetraphosphatase (symmetrical) YqeK [Anaerolineae bacterium]|nr:bis(5'-nucleosyl)-tetraphosphatase (symmetrical) YqeK [Anaerolineae bacterium]
MQQPAPSSDDSILEARARAWAQARMSAKRFHHSQGVVETVTQLARQHHLEPVNALRLAGWIHDAAKELSDTGLLEHAERFGLPIRPVERQAPLLLHGAVAAELAREELGLHDPVTLSAVTYHITGHPEMSTADKAFYLADLIEPGRDFKEVAQLRRLAAEDLDWALLFGITGQLRHLLKRAAAIDPRVLELRNRLIADGVPLAARDKA